MPTIEQARSLAALEAAESRIRVVLDEVDLGITQADDRERVWLDQAMLALESAERNIGKAHARMTRRTRRTP